MDLNKPLTYSIKPKKRKIKNFLYSGHKYPINFDLLVTNSDYFYYNEKSFQNINDIEIELPIEISEDSIQNFVLCCENQPFQINDTNIFSLNFLAVKYKVTELIRITNEYISSNHDKLVFQSIIYKNQIKKSDSFTVDFSAEEDIIASRLMDHINDGQLLLLSVPSLDRILKKYLHNSANNSDEKNESQIIEFLFKCLKKYKREASTLFMNFDFSKRFDIIQRLNKDFSDVFDFNLLNSKSHIKTIEDLLNEFSKLKCEYSICLKEKNEILDEFVKMRSKFNQIKNENQKLKEKLLNELSFSFDDYYLIPLRQKWQEIEPTKCSIQYKGTTISVEASSTYEDKMWANPTNLFNGENEVYHQNRWGCKPEQNNNYIKIHFSVPVRANALFMTASNYYVYEAPKEFEAWGFNDDESKKVVLLSIPYFNWFSNMKKMFRFDNENQYTDYKVILKSPDSQNGVIAFAELNLADIPF